MRELSHKKMYKAGKTWVVAGLLSFSVMGSTLAMVETGTVSAAKVTVSQKKKLVDKAKTAQKTAEKNVKVASSAARVATSASNDAIKTRSMASVAYAAATTAYNDVSTVYKSAVTFSKVSNADPASVTVAFQSATKRESTDAKKFLPEFSKIKAASTRVKSDVNKASAAVKSANKAKKVASSANHVANSAAKAAHSASATKAAKTTSSVAKRAVSYTKTASLKASNVYAQAKVVSGSYTKVMNSSSALKTYGQKINSGVLTARSSAVTHYADLENYALQSIILKKDDEVAMTSAITEMQKDDATYRSSLQKLGLTSAQATSALKSAFETERSVIKQTAGDRLNSLKSEPKSTKQAISNAVQSLAVANQVTSSAYNAIINQADSANAVISSAKSVQAKADYSASVSASVALAAAQKAHDTDATVSADKTAVKDAQAKVNAAQKIIDDKATGVPYIATPNNSDDSNKAFTGTHLITRTENLPTQVKDPKITTEQQDEYGQMHFFGYKETSADDTAVIKGQLTNTQQQALADYAVTLINNWRKSQGLSALVWSKLTQDLTVQNAINRMNAKIGDTHTSQTSLSTSFKKTISDNGMIYGGENMGIGSSDESFFGYNTTMLSLKVDILNTVTSMIYQDGDSSWGHLTNFKNANSIGVAAQVNKDPETSNDYPYLLMFNFYNMAQVWDDTSNMAVTPDFTGPKFTLTFESTYRSEINPTEKDYGNLNTAQSMLNDVNTQSVKDQKVIDAILTSAKATIAQQLKDAQAKNFQLTTLQLLIFVRIMIICFIKKRGTF